MIIYKTTNLINKKIYVGLDTHDNPQYYGSGKLILRALKKYGKKNFQKEIIEHCIDIDDLNAAEIFWIWKFDSLAPKGYNLAKGGDAPMLGRTHSKATKRKISKSHIGLKLSEETKQKLSKLRKSKKLSEETKRKISQSHMKKKHSIETCKKMSESHKGKNKYNIYEKDLQSYLLQKKSIIKIAEIYNCCTKTIYNYINKYQISD